MLREGAAADLMLEETRLRDAETTLAAAVLAQKSIAHRRCSARLAASQCRPRAAAPEAKYIDVLPCFPSASIVSMRTPVRAGEGLCTAIIGQRHGRDDCSDSEARLWF